MSNKPTSTPERTWRSGLRLWFALICACFAVLSAGDASPAEKPHITGIYSDLSYNDDDGVVGTEIFIVATIGDQGTKYAVFFQYWQSGTTLPVVVPAQVEGNFVTFDIPPPSMGEGQYKGHITNAGFEGTWRHPLVDGSSFEEPFRLKRKKSYWQ